VKARAQFEKDKKAFKVTFIVIVSSADVMLLLLYIHFFLATLMAFLNSLLNLIIYSFRLREFRVTFIE